MWGQNQSAKVVRTSSESPSVNSDENYKNVTIPHPITVNVFGSLMVPLLVPSAFKEIIIIII